LLNESCINERLSRQFWCLHLQICVSGHTQQHDQYTHTSGDCPFASISAHSSIGWCAMYITTFKDTTIFVLRNTQQCCNFHCITRYCNPIPDIAIPICNWGSHLSLSSPFENGSFENGDQVLEQVMSTMPSKVPSKASSDNIPPQDDNHEKQPSKDLASSDNMPPRDENPL
jgi:hypothetical protein